MLDDASFTQVKRCNGESGIGFSGLQFCVWMLRAAACNASRALAVI